MKMCSKCGVEEDESEFYKKKQEPQGLFFFSLKFCGRDREQSSLFKKNELLTLVIQNKILYNSKSHYLHNAL